MCIDIKPLNRTKQRLANVL